MRLLRLGYAETAKDQSPGSPDSSAIGVPKAQEGSGAVQETSRGSAAPIDKLSGPPPSSASPHPNPLPKGEGTAVAASSPGAPAEPPPALLTAFGKVVDPAGKPVAGADVYLREWSTYRISQDPWDHNPNDILAATKTDVEGKFRFENVPARPLHESWLKQSPWDVVIVAKPYALAWKHLSAAQPPKPFEIALAPEAKITGRVIDQQGRPIQGAEVKAYGLCSLTGDWHPQFTDPETLDLGCSRLAPAAKTDADGKLTIAGLPRGLRLDTIVTHDDFATGSVYVATTDQPQPDLDASSYKDGKKQESSAKVFSTAFSATLGPPSPRLAGRVTAADTKKPLAGLRVAAFWQSRGLDTLTDADGRFLFKETFGEPRYRLAVGSWPPAHVDYLGRLILVDLPKDKREVSVNVELPRGEIVSGTVLEEGTGKKVAGVHISCDAPFDVNATTKDELLPTGGVSDSEGRFRIAVPPGKAKLRISARRQATICRNSWDGPRIWSQSSRRR